MKVLLDECAPWPMHKILIGHQCTTAQKCGWKTVKNGELLRLAEQDQFDLFLTTDQGIQYEQNLTARTIRILTLSTNNLNRILAAAAVIQEAISKIQPGEFRRLDIP